MMNPIFVWQPLVGLIFLGCIWVLYAGFCLLSGHSGALVSGITRKSCRELPANTRLLVSVGAESRRNLGELFGGVAA